MEDFKKLTIWEKSHNWVLKVYRITSYFPPDELFNLVAQLRRSATSISTNIAEGCGTESSQEFTRFLNIAVSSACEAEYQLLLAYDLGYMKEQSYFELNENINEIKKMLNSFNNTLKTFSS
jgi:four helix bundle protein